MLVEANTPVILRGAAPSTWPAVRTWSERSILRKKLPPILMEVSVSIHAVCYFANAGTHAQMYFDLRDVSDVNLAGEEERFQAIYGP